MKGDLDRGRSLQELERDDWGEPAYDSGLVTTVHRLRRIPLAELTAGDLRILIGQGVGLPFLVPLALERLWDSPLVEGDLYGGDLLHAVSRIDEAFWAAHPESLQGVGEVAGRARRLLPTLDEHDRTAVLEILAAISRRLTE